ncbi:MAG TPA: hypothetical protein PLD01_17360 [Mycobacterium sp.]|nr:hypothetical protein [Mycobacterium sp.]
MRIEIAGSATERGITPDEIGAVVTFSALSLKLAQWRPNSM